MSTSNNNKVDTTTTCDDDDGKMKTVTTTTEGAVDDDDNNNQRTKKKNAKNDDDDAKNDDDDDPSLVYQRREVAEAFVNIRDTIPLCKEQMDTMIRIIKYFQPSPKHWLDLGCGDGPLAMRLLEEFPNASHGLLIDHSQPMLDLATTKFENANATNKDTTTDIQFQLGDFNDEDFLLTQSDKRYDVIVSGYAIHHVTHSRKQILYQRIFEILNPGGIFLNMEHVEVPTSQLESIFEVAFVDSMYDAFLKSTKGKKSRSEIEALVRHDLSVDSKANILAPVEIQCQWLRNIGYENVDCYFKFFILALFGGVKPKQRTVNQSMQN